MLIIIYQFNKFIIGILFLLIPIYNNHNNAILCRVSNTKSTVVCVNSVDYVNDSVKGKFYCPEPGKNKNLYHCCGVIGEQFCCDPHDTPGFKWGIAVAVIVGVFILLAVGYTIQVFRACDNCYHECPICQLGQEEEEFQWDTRWYSVSHEGNRYGVTFHSHKFAKYFMQQLEEHHGPWNTANILRIRKEGQDFVVLNIFFHDLFTPWFYTQGPIKNDEEWIKTDFRLMCQVVKETIAVRPFSFCLCSSPPDTQTALSTEPNLQATTAATTTANSSTMGQRRLLKPWTKTTYRGSSISQPSKLPNNKTNSTSKPDKKPVTSVILLDDVIEVDGNNKGIQTKRQIVVEI